MKFERYNPKLKKLARNLRKNGTKSEIVLWRYLRNKQLLGFDFHRQKPLGNYIVDFYCPEVRLAVEVDGYSHMQPEIVEKDLKKENYLRGKGIRLLRIKNEEVLGDITFVLSKIENATAVKDKQTTHPPRLCPSASSGQRSAQALFPSREGMK